MDVLGSLARPFTSTIKRGGAAIETMALLAQSPAFRKSIMGQKLTPQEVKELAGYKPAFSETAAVRTRGEQAKISAQDLAGIGAWLIPFGKGASLTSKALLPGAASGGLFAASERNATPGSVAGGAATGAITAGILNKLLGAGKATQKAGETLRQGVVKPKVAATPYAAAQEKAITQGIEKLGLKGGAAAQKGQMPGIMEKLSSQIDDILRQSKATEKSKVVIKAIKIIILKSEI